MDVPKERKERDLAEASADLLGIGVLTVAGEAAPSVTTGGRSRIGVSRWPARLLRNA
jgi:hypothetical protein